MTLEEIFQTSDPEQQARMAQQLKALAESPAMFMSLAVDARNPTRIIISRYDSAGSELDYEVCYAMLEHARRQLMAQERESLKRKAPQPEG